ncbi:MAG: endolytic transglycosylase MltG [Candidatus Pelagadaptatus aseana]|uniref:endolytic transglycosylase MltG n=1 Tax=Candidatus Pelagadaptatus aseana TaxID=3120508 RepID=UPI0039B349C7
MTRLQKILLGMALLPALMLISAGISLKMLTAPIAVATEHRTIQVQAGENLTIVANRLARKGVVQHPRMLVLFARLMDQTNIKLGEYELAENTSDLEVLQLLLSGQVISYKITLVEGTTFKESLDVLAQQDKLQHTLKGKTVAEIAGLMGISQPNPEGWLFPDTYQYTEGSTDLDLLLRAYQRMQQVLEDEWGKRTEPLPYETPYEALIMASIVEKETGVPSERADIAGVFVRRLNKGMRLQTDPTIIYGLGDDYQGNIRRHHLKQATPYNTYVINGLTPTPIALPGRAAIQASLNPKDGDALFFVAKGDGSHYFSATLAEHEEAVRQYQLTRKANYRSAPQ